MTVMKTIAFCGSYTDPKFFFPLFDPPSTLLAEFLTQNTELISLNCLKIFNGSLLPSEYKPSTLALCLGQRAMDNRVKLRSDHRALRHVIQILSPSISPL